MRTFPLTNGWSVEYFEPNIDGFEMAPSPEAISRLSEWRCSPRFATAGFYAYLRRTFEIEREDARCVRYFVQVENAPGTTRVYVNDTHVADADGRSTRVDVTDFVWMGENKLNLRVDCWKDDGARFEAVNLLQVPCEDAWTPLH